MLLSDLSQYSSIEYDSRKVLPGSIFVAIKGEKSDGHNFLEEVVNKGAKALVVDKQIVSADRKLQEILAQLKSKVEIYELENIRYQLARLSHIFYNKPSEKLTVIGVTGTNGKTTVTHLIQNILNHKQRCAVLGTMGLKESSDADYQEMNNTTPQSKELHQIMKGLVDKGFQALTMEVSSHALEQYRVGEVWFKTAIVTNLTQDHLDYHLTMDSYYQAKAKIFKQTKDYAILNPDDDYYSRFLAAAQDAGLKIITAAVNNQADLMAKNLSFSDRGLSYELVINSKVLGINASINISSRLNGMFNVYNSMSAIAAALIEGVDLQTIQKALADSAVVAGRFEMIKEANSPFCVVDYAHSPDGLVNVLKGARALISEKQSGKLICLFGCGGDRDITKRPKMGKIAYEMADFVYVTSNNPRSEDPEQIVADILTGIPDMSKVKVIVDRRQAIQEAIRKADLEDIVVIAGKGHEDYQIIKDQKFHFDDREEVRKAIAV